MMIYDLVTIQSIHSSLERAVNRLDGHVTEDWRIVGEGKGVNLAAKLGIPWRHTLLARPRHRKSPNLDKKLQTFRGLDPVRR